MIFLEIPKQPPLMTPTLENTVLTDQYKQWKSVAVLYGLSLYVQKTRTFEFPKTLPFKSHRFEITLKGINYELIKSISWTIIILLLHNYY